MQNRLMFLLIFVSFLAVAPATYAGELPTEQEMNDLKPTSGLRLQWYDKAFPAVAQSADAAHLSFSDPSVLADVEARLERVRQTGQVETILTVEERMQFAENLEKLRHLENAFFDRWYLRAPMDAAINFQRWLTSRNSPEPKWVERAVIALRLQDEQNKNPLYGAWFKSLPENLKQPGGPETWGELLLRFNKDVGFRNEWVLERPESLPRLLQLSRIWAWEDSSVRAVTVNDIGTPTEYWVLLRRPRLDVPNRFLINHAGDVNALIRLEYAPTVFFNRVSRIAKNGETIIYYFEAVEKGRTMEISKSHNENGVNKKTFPGASFLRKTKSDELLQRGYVQRGTLNLFLGLRTLQLDQIQELMRISPELMLAVGQFGFSISGGRAQTVSNRTDSPKDQLSKLTATMIDIIEFANTKDVDAWFRDNTKHVLRTMIAGVGAGGTSALKNPVTIALPSGQMCRALFVLSRSSR